MSKQYIHISFNWSGKTKAKELEPTFNSALDWIRYAPNCWIVWTSSDADKWFSRLKPHLGPQDNMLICQIDPDDCQGWLEQWVWDWLNKKRK